MSSSRGGCLEGSVDDGRDRKHRLLLQSSTDELERRRRAEDLGRVVLLPDLLLHLVPGLKAKVLGVECRVDRQAGREGRAGVVCDVPDSGVVDALEIVVSEGSCR